ncbi:MAG: PLP-dependent aminotransferase family protein [Eubacterium sp.]
MKKYTELYNIIRNKIESGELASGDKIPSVRKAAELYRVSVTTVQNAYFDLCADGYIISAEKKGYFVTDMINTNADFEHFPKEQEYFCDLTGGIADKDAFDIKLWQRYVKSALRQEERLLSYSDPQGEYDLRLAITKYIYEKRNIITSPERIVIGAGVQPLLHIICSLIGGESKSVSFPDSSFRQGIGLFSDHGFEVHTRDKDADIIYVCPSHMTSWGDVMPIKRRLELTEYSYKNNSIVIEDDYENEFQYNSRPTPSLFALGKGNIIYMGSFSAMLLPGIRISFMVLTEKLTKEFENNKFKFAQTAGITEQIALCNYIRDGHIYSQTRKIRRLYTAKTKRFMSLLKNEIPGINAKISENALQIIIKTKSSQSLEKFEKEKIRLDIPDEHTLVMSPIGLPEEEFGKAVKAICTVIE